jgi:hypothetical protein
MKTFATSKNLGYVLLLAAALALPILAVGSQEDNEGPDGGNQQKAETGAEQTGEQGDEEKGEDKKEPRTLKIFELEHRAPQEIAQILTLLWPGASPFHPAGRQFSSAGQPSQLAGQQPFPPGTPGASAAPARPAIAFDPEEKLLFVRATADQLEKIETLVNGLDVSPENLERQELDGLHLIPVRQDRVDQVTRILRALQLPSQTMTMGDAHLIVLRVEEGAEDDGLIDQVRQVVSKLNAEEVQGGNGEQDSDENDQESEEENDEENDEDES